MSDETSQLLLTLSPVLVKRLNSELKAGGYLSRQEIILRALREYFDRRDVNLLAGDSNSQNKRWNE